jgi:ribosomal protein S8E
MNRESIQPFNYASLTDLQRSLLLQIRRFNKACAEIAAMNVISLGPLKSSKVIKVKRQNTKSMEQLELLRNQLRLLRNMRGQLFTSFSNDPKAEKVRQQIEDLIAGISERLNSLQQGMSDEVSEQINPGVRKVTNAVVKELQTDLKLKDEQIGTQIFIGLIAAPGKMEANINAEIAYIFLKGIKTADGYTSENMVAAIGFPGSFAKGAEEDDPLAEKPNVKSGKAPNSLVDIKNRKHRTGELDQTKMSKIYIALLTGFKIPSKIRWDANVNTTGDVKKVIHDLLTRHGVISLGENRTLPIPKESINFSHNNIKSTSVRGNAVEVKVNDIKTINATADELRMQLKSIIAALNPNNKDLIRTRVLQDAGIIRFVFSLPFNLKGRMIDNNMLERLRKTLNLLPEDLNRVRSALENHGE